MVILRQCLGAEKVLKPFSETGWSSRDDALTALCNGYKYIVNTLTSIRKHYDRPGET